jgi:S1-C subfamily serine protease
VYELERDALRSAGKWHRDQVWVYPLPENLGITLETDRGDLVQAVAGGSPAAKAGLQAGDILRTLNGQSVASFGDAQYALHRAPASGRIPFTAERGGRKLSGQLELTEGWRETNITWRTSLLDLLPSLSIFGQDLSAEEKKALGLSPKRLAFRQDKNVHPDAKAAGVRENDIIVGVNHKKLEMDMLQFLGYVRRHFRVGERITLDVIRDGKPLELSVLLR